MTEDPNIDRCARPDALRDSIGWLRQNLARVRVAPGAVADALAAVFERWRDRNFSDRVATITKIAAASGWSTELLDESIDALLAPFSRDALASFASMVRPRLRVGGFFMPANVPAAGMHELVAALLSGAAAIVKTSNREPMFFHAFAHTLTEIDPAIGNRVKVVAFGREREDLTRAMKQECNFLVALGDDATIAHLAGGARVFGFGSRTSGAVISLAAPANFAALAYAIARDVTLFEQQGCLSPHHVFVADADASLTRDFVRELARAMTSLVTILPPARLSFHTAATIRRIRESARWRGIGTHRVELYEGASLAWTVVFDEAARFAISPGYRTVTITPIRDHDDLASRLAPVAGRLEAFALAIAAPSRARYLDVLAGAGVTYVCDPGKTQSPPLAWPHGGGAFLDFLAARDE
jgi:hypothetical protein